MKNFITILAMILSFNLSSQTIKMKSYRSKPIIELDMNGKKAYFIVDSGADVSVLNSKSSEEYAFQSVKDYKQYSATGFSGQNYTFYKAKNANVYFEGLELRTVFYATDLENLAYSIKEKTSYLITGIIGADLLNRYGFVIDYKNKTITANP